MIRSPTIQDDGRRDVVPDDVSVWAIVRAHVRSDRMPGAHYWRTTPHGYRLAVCQVHRGGRALADLALDYDARVIICQACKTVADRDAAARC